MNLALPSLRGTLPPPLRANSGGPASRQRTERITASLLGERVGHVGCPRVWRLGLDFGADLQPPDPVDYLHALLASQGFDGPESLRSAFAAPAHRLMAVPLGAAEPVLQVATASPQDVLEQALLLGLCTRHLYDPARPVLWTTASLGRRLELFDPAGFYA